MLHQQKKLAIGVLYCLLFFSLLGLTAYHIRDVKAQPVGFNFDSTKYITLKPENKYYLANDAATLLDHINAAYTQLNNKIYDSAIFNVVRAHQIIQGIDETMIYEKLTTRELTGDLSKKNNISVNPAYVPVYKEFYTRSIIDPILVVQENEATDKLSVNRRNLVSSNKIFTESYIDINSADDYIYTAQQAMLAKNYERAKEALRQIQLSVIFTEIKANENLAKARKYLLKSQNDLKNYRLNDAIESLQVATDYLDEYEDNNELTEANERLYETTMEQLDELEDALEDGRTGLSAEYIRVWENMVALSL